MEIRLGQIRRTNAVEVLNLVAVTARLRHMSGRLIVLMERVVDVGRKDPSGVKVDGEPALLPKSHAFSRMKGGLRQIPPMQGLGGSDMVKLAQGQRLHPIQRGGHLVKKP